jgi:hypothetical protein
MSQHGQNPSVKGAKATPTGAAEAVTPAAPKRGDWKSKRAGGKMSDKRVLALVRRAFAENRLKPLQGEFQTDWHGLGHYPEGAACFFGAVAVALEKECDDDTVPTDEYETIERLGRPLDWGEGVICGWDDWQPDDDMQEALVKRRRNVAGVDDDDFAAGYQLGWQAAAEFEPAAQDENAPEDDDEEEEDEDEDEFEDDEDEDEDDEELP